MPRRPNRSRDAYTPRLTQVWLAGLVVTLITAAILWGFYVALDHLVPQAAASRERTSDVLKGALAMAAFLGAVLTGLYAYRNQRLAEGASLRADSDQMTSRLGRAAEMLGHNSPATRLAGVFAMSALADEWTTHRQLCIDVLTGYLQVPYKPASEDAEPDEKSFGEHEVRRAILRTIRDHLREDTPSASKWYRNNFRFEGATFYGGDLTGAIFLGQVTFHGARFKDQTFHFNKCRFAGPGIWFTNTIFENGHVEFHSLVLGAETVMSFENASRLPQAQVTFRHLSGGPGKVIPGPFLDQLNGTAWLPSQ